MRLFSAPHPQLSVIPLLLDVERHFQSQRTDALEDQGRERIINNCTGNILTHGTTLFYVLFLANVIGTEPTAPPVVAQRHRPAALAANDQSLKQGRTFPRRSALVLDDTRLPVVLPPLLIFLKLFPADIARMEVFDQDVPLVAGQARKTPSALSIFPGAGSSETKRSGVARVVQSIQSDGMAQRLPD